MRRAPPESVPLREYFDAKHQALIEMLNERFLANGESVTLARNEIDRRLAEMNNLRAQIYADANTYVRQEKLDATIGALREQLGALEKVTRALVDTQAASWQAALAAQAKTLQDRLSELERYRANAEGRAALLSQLIVLVPMSVGIVEFVIIKFVK